MYHKSQNIWLLLVFENTKYIQIVKIETLKCQIKLVIRLSEAYFGKNGPS